MKIYPSLSFRLFSAIYTDPFKEFRKNPYVLLRKNNALNNFFYAHTPQIVFHRFHFVRGIYILVPESIIYSKTKIWYS